MRSGAAVCSHGNVIGLFLHHAEPGAGKLEAEAIRNPDVLRITYDGARYAWDRSFDLAALHEFATDHTETPMRR